MKKIAVFLIAMLTLISCKEKLNSNTTSAVTSKDAPQLRTFKGEFIYLADAAVLKVDNIMYSVEIDEKMHQLQTIIAPKKSNEFDMIEVIIKGEVKARPTGEEGWPHIITIKEIVKILDKTGDEPIQIKNAPATN